MAGRAVHQVLDTNVVRAKEIPLLFAGLRGRRRRSKELRQWTEVGSRVAMAAEAPPHRQRLALFCYRHPPDFPMAGGAANSLVHMNAMIKVHVIGQLGDSDPLQRHISRRALKHRSQRSLV